MFLKVCLIILGSFIVISFLSTCILQNLFSQTLACKQKTKVWLTTGSFKEQISLTKKKSLWLCTFHKHEFLSKMGNTMGKEFPVNQVQPFILTAESFEKKSYN